MKLQVGDVVAYPPHGVGRVSAREKSSASSEGELVVIELADDLSVTLPLERARTVLRPLVGEEDLRRIEVTLREEGAVSDDIWSKRLREAQEKLRRGDALELAEIVRDGAQRQRALNASGSSKLSVSERALWTKARELLSVEIGHVRGIERAEASAWIDERLAPLESSGSQLVERR